MLNKNDMVSLYKLLPFSFVTSDANKHNAVLFFIQLAPDIQV